MALMPTGPFFRLVRKWIIEDLAAGQITEEEATARLDALETHGVQRPSAPGQSEGLPYLPIEYRQCASGGQLIGSKAPDAVGDYNGAPITPGWDF